MTLSLFYSKSAIYLPQPRPKANREAAKNSWRPFMNRGPVKRIFIKGFAFSGNFLIFVL